jgi:PAS domain S-box-containing protein
MKAPAKFADWISKGRWHRFLLFVLLMVLPIVFFSFSVGRVLRHQIESQSVTESTQIGRITATLVQEHFQQSMAFLESFASRPSLRQAWKQDDLKLVEWNLAQASALHPDFVFFSVYDLDGTLRAIYPPQPTVLNRNFAYRDWYQGVTREWKPYVSEVYQTVVSPNELVVASAVPLTDAQGRPVGILMAPFAVDTISQWLAEAKLEDAWTISLVDHNGHLAAHPEMDPRVPAVDLGSYEPIRQVRAGRAGNGTFERDGDTFFARYQPVRPYGWAVLVEQPSDQLQQGLWAIERRVWLLGFVFLVVGIGVSAFMGSLYARLETGNRFMHLSIDMFCIAGGDGFFKRLNPAWQAVLGYSTEELMAKPYLEFIHPEDREATLAEKQRLHHGEITIAFENRYRCKDGSYKWLLWNAVSEPEKKLVYAVARDITDRKRVEQQIAQTNRELELRNREVERATQLKSKFLASMSHELRTPLNAIVGFSGLIAEETTGQLNEKQKRFIEHIKQGADHLLQLINDILDLSKIEAGQLELRCDDFRLQDALPEVLSTIRPLAMVKNIQVEHQFQGNRQVHADRVRVKQILYNLLSNAVKFTPKAGRINIECTAKGDFVFVSVSDSGIGIRVEDQQVIFEEFRQVDGNHSNEGGTGLGLAITKRLVEQQGGGIWLESEPGKGSRFTFSLPAGARAVPDKTQSPVPSLQAPAESSGKPLVLIVDDELAARELLASYLEPEYRIAAAATGVEAVEKAQQLQPDAITLDVLMAGGTGFETLVALRKAPETANIPVIIVSVVDQRGVGFALGAADYLIKPIRKAVLLESVRKHTQSRSKTDAAVLVVDDDASTRELLNDILRSAGYQTRCVMNGREALSALSSVPVSAILLDLLMPDMDGFQVIQEVRQNAKLKEIPILVMTAKNLTKDEIALLNRDTQVLLQKDGSWQRQLVAEVGKVIKRRKRATAAGRT